jgi:hypothetical protein
LKCDNEKVTLLDFNIKKKDNSSFNFLKRKKKPACFIKNLDVWPMKLLINSIWPKVKHLQYADIPVTCSWTKLIIIINNMERRVKKVPEYVHSFWKKFLSF